MDKVNYNPDVLTCLASLSNDEVFTPIKLVNQMLDMLPKEIWDNKEAKFLDPSCKTGVFLREIARRLIKGLEKEIPDLQKRLDHIFRNQLYGTAITELTSLLSRRGLYCSKNASGKFSVCACFNNPEGNIKFYKMQHSWKDGRCVCCGASKELYDRGDDLESHAYPFIHALKPEEIFKMKFDVIIGNPPYQLNDDGFGKSATPLYHKFVQQAKKLNPRYLIMIIPSRWFAGGKGLDEFREEMLNDNQIKKIVDFWDSTDCFPGVDIAGGVCYFLREKDYRGECEIVNVHKDKVSTSIRPLNEFPTLVRFGTAAEIIKKVKQLGENSMSNQVSGRKPFGLPTNARPAQTGDLQLFWNGGIGPFSSKEVFIGKELISKWKVVTSKVSYDHGGQPDKDGMRRVLSRVEILPPNTICTETYIIVGSFNKEETAKNLISYLKTKFVRFLISQMSFSQDITKDRFFFVPIQDFSKPWADEELYHKYNLTEKEIEFIEKMIRPLDLNKVVETNLEGDREEDGSKDN